MTPRKHGPRAKPLGVGRAIKLRAYSIVSESLECTVRGMFRRAAKHSLLDPHGEITEEQHARAHSTLMNDLCELLDFGD